jgi:hypothetical protein
MYYIGSLRKRCKCGTIAPVIAPIAQLVERIHGKDEVTGSNPVWGSMIATKTATFTVAVLFYNNFRLRQERNVVGKVPDTKCQRPV